MYLHVRALKRSIKNANILAREFPPRYRSNGTEVQTHRYGGPENY